MKTKNILLLAFLFSAPLLLLGDGNLIVNGNFEKVNRYGHPEGWTVSHPNYLADRSVEVMVLNDGERNYWRVTKNNVNHVDLGTQKVDIPEGTKALRIRVRMRGEDIVAGDQHWMLPGVGVSYLYPDGSTRPGVMSKWIYLQSGSSPWIIYDTEIPVRDNAPQASISLSGHGWTGTAEFADVTVEAVR